MMMHCKSKPSNITYSEYGKFLFILENLSKDNKLKHKENGTLLTTEYISEAIGYKENKYTNRFFKKFIELGIMSYNNYIYYINPIYFHHNNFKWYKEIFDIFKPFIETELYELEYLKLKSNWYEVNHQIIMTDHKNMINNLSGLYKLYKNNTIIYIGKSINIKGRIKEHSKTKDFDSFDFTIINNESNKNIMELYLIDKHKPLLNKDCIEESICDLDMIEPIFSNIIKL